MASDPRQTSAAREQMRLLANSVLLSREALIRRFADAGGGCRDLARECGYPLNLSAKDYLRMYEEDGIARRVVGAFADECWSIDPQVYEREDPANTPFEDAWDELLDTIFPWHYLHRADEMSGVGRFGVLLFGFDDGGNPLAPAPNIDPRTGQATGTRTGTKLLYHRVFDETQVEVARWQTDKTSPRYGLPDLYRLTVSDLQTAPVGGEPPPNSKLDVHWTRVLHLADNRTTSEVFGTPRIKPVEHRLLDLDKILSGSAEMYWKAAFPGISFEALPEALANSDLLDEDTKKDLKDQTQRYEEGLTRYFALVGMTAKPLAVNLSEPTNFIVQQVQAIAASLAIPYRVFMGSEAAHLASTQDITTWNKRVARRQRLYLNPMVVRPYVQRLIDVGVLPRPKQFFVTWTDLNGLSDKDKADVALKRAQALMAYVSGNVEAAFPLKEFLTLVMGLSPKEADAVFAAADRLTEAARQTPDPAAQKQAEMDMQKELADQQMKQDAKTAAQDRKVMAAKAKATRKPTSPGAAAAA